MTNRELRTWLLYAIAMTSACVERPNHPTEENTPRTFEVAFGPHQFNLDRWRAASVFLLSEWGFDATTVQAGDVRLVVEGGHEVSVSLLRGRYWTRDVDYDHDGDMDRLFFFLTADLIAGGVKQGRPVLALSYRVGAQIYRSSIPAPIVFRGPSLHYR